MLIKILCVLLVTVQVFRSNLLYYQFNLISNQCIPLVSNNYGSLLLLIGRNRVSGSAVAVQTRVGQLTVFDSLETTELGVQYFSI